MKILKFLQYIKESESPDSYVDEVLTQIKSKIEKMFEDSSSESDNDDDVKKIGEYSKNKKDNTFKDMGLTLEDSEISKYSKTDDSYKVKFSDENYLYDLTFLINLSEVISPDDDPSSDKIKKCKIIFKKYSLEDNFEMIGKINKEEKIDNIDEDFLINLKIEIDEKYGDDDEDFKIETE